MFSLHSFFLLFSPTSEFVPATVFWVAIFLALKLFVSMTQMTILADFFPHQCTVLVMCRNNLRWFAGSDWLLHQKQICQFHLGLVEVSHAGDWMAPACLCLLHHQHTHTHTHAHTRTHTHTHTHTRTAVGFSQLCTVQRSTETHQNTWKWQSEHQEPVSNGIFNHQGFPSKPCLSVFSNC